MSKVVLIMNHYSDIILINEHKNQVTMHLVPFMQCPDYTILVKSLLYESFCFSPCWNSFCDMDRYFSNHPLYLKHNGLCDSFRYSVSYSNIMLNRQPSATRFHCKHCILLEIITIITRVWVWETDRIWPHGMQ